MSNAAATETVSATATPTAAKPGLGAVLVPVLASTVLTLSVVGGAVFYLVHTGRLGAAVAASSAAPPAVIVVAPPASHVMALEPIIVNLSDAGGRSYLRAGVSLRIKDEEKKEEKKEDKKDAKAVDAVGTELRDTTLAVLSRQTSDALLSTDGREQLKQELEREYKQRNAEIPVLEVFFTDFLVQRG